MLYPEDLDGTRDEIGRACRGGTIWHFRCRYLHKDGHIVMLMWTGLRSPDSQQHCLSGRDVTELNDAERRLREAHEQAVSANLAKKSRFLATASHDSRQSLHAINLFIRALQWRGAATRHPDWSMASRPPRHRCRRCSARCRT